MAVREVTRGFTSGLAALAGFGLSAGQSSTPHHYAPVVDAHQRHEPRTKGVKMRDNGPEDAGHAILLNNNLELGD